MSQSTSTYDYATSSAFRRFSRILVTFRPIALVSARMLPGLDGVIHRVTGGRTTVSGFATGLPILLLTTKGARSGEPRTARVLGIPDGDGYIVVASNFGQDANPGWYYNLRAHPEVSVADGNAEGAYHARVLSGAERESAYQRALSANPGWKRFQKQAGERAIPVVRLDAA